MSPLANLYIRTPLGRVTAFNPAAALPAPLKTLLKAVDGKTTTMTLEAAYADLGDVASLFAILQDNGLIADKNAAAIPAAAVAAAVAPVDHPSWANSDNPLLDSSFSDLGASMFGQFPVPSSHKPG